MLSDQFSYPLWVLNIYSYEAEGTYFAISFMRVSGTTELRGLCKLPGHFQSQEDGPEVTWERLLVLKLDFLEMKYLLQMKLPRIQSEAHARQTLVELSPTSPSRLRIA